MLVYIFSTAKPPTLDMSSMPEMEKRILQRRINTDTNNMIEQYALLRAHTEGHLHEIHCDVEKLLVCIMDVQHIKRISKESPLVQLEAQHTISGVFLELVKKNLISFLQFSILKRIITELCAGSQELQEKLKAYELEFNEYIKRRVCETRIYHEGRFEAFSGSKSDKKVELLIITDENWDDSIKFVKVLDLEALITKCLKIDCFDLQIFRIELKCLRIRYAISIDIARTVFPLTNEEWKKLSHLGIIKIHCEEYFYSTEDKGMYSEGNVAVLFEIVCFFCCSWRNSFQNRVSVLFNWYMNLLLFCFIVLHKSPYH